MANYKKIETLAKNFEAITSEMLNDIVGNENVDVETLTDKEKFSILVFSEMRKALDTKEHELVLDCNYAKSGMHNKTEKQIAKGSEPQWLVDYYRLVSKDEDPKSLIQIYVFPNPKSGTCKFNLCTSCAKMNLEQFLAMRDELQFEPLINKKTQQAKTTERKGIPYEELVDIVKAVCAVLTSTEKAKADAKAAKEKEKEVPEDTEEDTEE